MLVWVGISEELRFLESDDSMREARETRCVPGRKWLSSSFWIIWLSTIDIFMLRVGKSSYWLFRLIGITLDFLLDLKFLRLLIAFGRLIKSLFRSTELRLAVPRLSMIFEGVVLVHVDLTRSCVGLCFIFWLISFSLIFSRLPSELLSCRHCCELWLTRRSFLTTWRLRMKSEARLAPCLSKLCWVERVFLAFSSLDIMLKCLMCFTDIPSVFLRSRLDAGERCDGTLLLVFEPWLVTHRGCVLRRGRGFSDLSWLPERSLELSDGWSFVLLASSLTSISSKFTSFYSSCLVRSGSLASFISLVAALLFLWTKSLLGYSLFISSIMTLGTR